MDAASIIRALAKSRGALGKARAEQVFDEVPHVLEHYRPAALKADLESGGPAIRFRPSLFERSADPIPGGTYEHLDNALYRARPWYDIPFLTVGPGRDPYPDRFRITGHEGRHRNRALARNEDRDTLIFFQELDKDRELIDFVRKKKDYEGRLDRLLDLIQRDLVYPERSPDVEDYDYLFGDHRPFSRGGYLG